MKKAYIIAGPNGSGKSTLAQELIHDTGLIFLNADDIANQIDKNNFSKVRIQAGKEFLNRLM